ncbi:MAG: hypothetical protein ACAF41_21085 [Leptolyngbya sp. BL-A-14]
MTERVNHATERSTEAAACAVSLMHHYGFDLGGYTLAQLLANWQEQYPTAWIRLATIEALYQGRYKAISIEQILAMWQRRSQPLHHFNHEFERLVCENLPDQTALATLPPSAPPTSSTVYASKLLHPGSTLQLPRLGGSVPPETDVMLALRTLHSEEMAALTEPALLKTIPTEVQQSEADGQPPLQTYSYTLRSDEQPSPTHGYQEVPIQEEDESISSIESGDESNSASTSNADTITASESEVIAAEVNSDTSQKPLVAPSPSTENNATLGADEVADTSIPLAFSQSDVHPRSSLSQVGSIAKILQQLEHQELKPQALFSALSVIPPPLKPKLQLHLTTHYQPIWLTDPSRTQPIHQFTPDLKLSDFHDKLKAVAQSAEAAQEGDLSP